MSQRGSEGLGKFSNLSYVGSGHLLLAPDKVEHGGPDRGQGLNGKCYTRDRLRRWVPCSPSSFRVARGGRAPVHATWFQALSWSELRASRASFFKAQTSTDRSHVPAFPVAVCQGKPPVAASNAEPACSMLGLQKALRCSRHESSDSKAAPSSGGKFFSGPSALSTICPPSQDPTSPRRAARQPHILPPRDTTPAGPAPTFQMRNGGVRALAGIQGDRLATTASLARTPLGRDDHSPRMIGGIPLPPPGRVSRGRKRGGRVCVAVWQATTHTLQYEMTILPRTRTRLFRMGSGYGGGLHSEPPAP